MSRPVEHPEWCQIEWCDTSAPADVEHRVLPDIWTTHADVGVVVGMSQDDEHGVPWRAGVRLQLADLVTTAETAVVEAYLSPDEADHLALQLHAHAARARRAAARTFRTEVPR